MHDIRSGYPVVLTTAEKPGPLVAVDNAGGIRQAFDHLWRHGHRRMAFSAGKSGRGGDTMERLAAYRKAQRSAGIPDDVAVIGFDDILEATLVEVRHSTRQEIEARCLDLARAFASSLSHLVSSYL